MRIARKLMLLVVTAMAALALTAGSASAQEDVEVVNEASQEHCGGLESGNECEVEWTDEIAFQNHVFGIEVTIYDCRLTFEMEIDEDGGAEVDVAFFAHSGTSNCTPQACDTPWPAQFHEEVTGLAMDVEICYQLGGNKMRCQFDIPLVDNGGHSYGMNTELSGTAHENVQACEYTSGLTIEPSSPDDIEFVH